MHINRFVKKDSRAIENSDWFHFRFRAGRVAIDALMTRISVLGEPKSIGKDYSCFSSSFAQHEKWGAANVYPIVSGFEELERQHLSAERDMLA